MTTDIRTMYPGTVEYLTGTITADLEVTDADTIEVTLDRGTTWSAAEWVGAAGTTRSWRILLGDTIPLPTKRSPVYLRITDNPEVPIVRAGTLNISAL